MGTDRVTLYVRERRSEIFTIVPDHDDVMSAIRAAFRFSANPDYQVRVNGQVVRERKAVTGPSDGHGIRLRKGQVLTGRAHVMGHNVRAESPSTHPNYGEFTLVKTKKGSRKRVRKPVPPMSPPPKPETKLTAPPELREDMAAVETLSRQRAREVRNVDAYDLANARRAAKREGREFNY
jgi:hypothetical protein